MKLRAMFGIWSTTVLLATAAHAKEEFVPKVPNGAVFNCTTCHNAVNPDNGDESRNSFGVAVNSVRSGNTINWSQICDLDTDNDGQTNGLELGDPDCVWSTGQVPARTTDISRPADATSMTSAGGEGAGEGSSDGSTDGSNDGSADGAADGSLEGAGDGGGEGAADGGSDGATEGTDVDGGGGDSGDADSSPAGCPGCTGSSPALAFVLAGMLRLGRRVRRDPSDRGAL